MAALNTAAFHFAISFTISAGFNTFPDETSFSLTTSAGMDIAPYSMICCKSVMYATSMPIPSTALTVLSYN